jgi:CDP-glucose 4,6-dehydratase
MGLNETFWKDKRVLITGHTGFKGSWLSLWLIRLGARVIGYSLPPPTVPCLFEIAAIQRQMRTITGDIRDLKHVTSVMETARPQIVFHMAAQALVRQSYEQPVETYETNVMGTIHLLEAVRRTDSVRALICITSDKCYENKEWLRGYRESDPMGGHDPYSSSKGCAELVISAFRRSFFSDRTNGNRKTAIASTRAGNVIGGGDWGKDRLIPDMLQALSTGNLLRLRNPHATRPWQHVLDPLAGYMRLAEKMVANDANDRFSKAWNFGPGDNSCQPVSWLVEQVNRLSGGKLNWQVDDREGPKEAHFLKLDCSQAQNELGWSPKLNISTALEWVMEWHALYRKNKNMREVTEDQISRYERMEAAL